MFSHRQDANHSLFAAIDGDDVGDKLRTFILHNELEEAQTFSQRIHEFVQTASECLLQMGANIIFCGGDSILAEFEQEAVDLAWIHELPDSPCTFSVGIGYDPVTAYLALQLAKGFGKNRTILYSSLLDPGNPWIPKGR